MAIKNQADLVKSVKDLKNLANLPPLVDNATVSEVMDYLNNVGAFIPDFLGNKGDKLTSSTFTTPPYDIVALKDVIRERRQELMLAQIDAQISMANLPPLPTVTPPATEISPDQIRSYLIKHGEKLGFNPSGFTYNAKNLTDAQANEIRDAINDKREILIPKAIIAITNIKLLPAFSDSTKTDEAQIRLYLQTNGKNLGCNPESINFDSKNLPDATALVIVEAICKQRNKLIIAKINVITDFSIFPSFDAPADEVAVRAYLEKHGVQLGLSDAPIKYTEHNLPNNLAKEIAQVIIKKQTELLLKHIQANPQLATLPALGNNASDKDVLDYINNNKTVLNVTATYNAENISDLTAIKEVLIQRRRELIMAQFSGLGANATDVQMKALGALVRATDEKAIRAILADTQYSAQFAAFGLNATNCADDKYMSNENAKEVRKLALVYIKEINSKKIIKAIESIDDQKASQTEMDLLFKIVNSSAPDIRVAVHKNPILGNVDISDRKNRPYLLEDKDADQASKAATVKAMQIVIAQHQNYRDVENPPDPATNKVAFKAQLLKIAASAKPPLNGITAAHLDELDDASLKVIYANFSIQSTNLLQAETDKNMQELTEYPKEAYENLQILIAALTTDQRKLLLANNSKLLLKLIAAQTKHEVLEVARECGINDANAVDNYVEENTKRTLYLSVNNRALATVLVTMPFRLSEHAIEALNTVLDDYKNVNLTGPLTLQRFKNDVSAILSRPPFATPAEITMLLGAIDGQSANIAREVQANAFIIEEMNKPGITVGDKAIYIILAGISNKNNTTPFNGLDFQAIKQLMGTAKTYAEFIQRCDAELKKPIVNAPTALQNALLKLGPNYKQGFTEQRYKWLQMQMVKNSFLGADPKKVLKEQKEKLNDITEENKAFRDKNKSLLKKIEALSSQNAFEFLAGDPSIYGREKAMIILLDVKTIAVACDELCRGLQQRLRELELMQAAIPSDEEIKNLDMLTRQQIKSHRANVQSEINKVKTDLTRYQEVHKWLHGDPTKVVPPLNPTTREITNNRGIVKVVEDAAAGKPFTQAALPADWQQCDDVDSSAVKSHIQALHGSSTNVNVNAATAIFAGKSAAQTLLSDAGDIAKGKVRVHGFNRVVRTNSTGVDVPIISGCAYTEERGTYETRLTEKGSEMVRPVTMTLQCKPKLLTKTPTDADKSELTKRKVMLFTNMAADILSKMGKVPSASDPIYISGSDPEAAGMLWTALIELGKADPNFAFDASAIVVKPGSFDPKSQMSSFGKGYSSDSYYNQYYKGSCGDYLRDMQKDVKTFYGNAAAIPKDQKQMQASMGDLRKAADKTDDVSIQQMRKPTP